MSKIENLTAEQQEKIKKLKKKFAIRGTMAIMSYIGFLFMANLAIAIINLAYVHDKSFEFMLTLGTAVIVFAGMKGTLDEISKETVDEMDKIIKEGK